LRTKALTESMEASVVVVALLVVGWWLLAGPSKAKRDRAREALEIEIQIGAIDGKTAKDIVRELVDQR
jgi:type II secretory pathway component PulM